MPTYYLKASIANSVLSKRSRCISTRSEERPTKRPRNDTLEMTSNIPTVSIPKFCSHSAVAHERTEVARLQPQLPPEILHNIFALVHPPDSLLDPSLHCGPNSAWCKATATKLALISAGVDLLYRTIAIRRMPTVAGLLTALTAKPWLGSFVRTIQLLCYVPSASGAAVKRDMARIFALCPGLNSMTHLPPLPPPPELSFPIVPSTVTSLTLGPHISARDTHHTLQRFCAQLKHLSLPVRDQVQLDAVALSFPVLQSLTLTLNGAAAPRTFAVHWRMPRLTHLRFRVCTSTESTHDLAAAYEHILRPHGRTLTSLAFPGSYPIFVDTRRRNLDYAPLLRLCPALAHAVLPETHELSTEVPGVRRLDVWVPDLPTRTAKGKWGVSAATRARLPNLQSVRLLDTALIPHVPDAPAVFDAREEGQAEWALVYPGLAIAQEVEHHTGVVKVLFGDQLMRGMDMEDSWCPPEEERRGSEIRTRTLVANGKYASGAEESGLLGGSVKTDFQVFSGAVGIGFADPKSANVGRPEGRHSLPPHVEL
ncbi:hypothetical protein C8R43DRAFT_1228899 [Mycena crocata]|nr:hypothetical protein C8R43DRAFT_1228899 [Mycena crocata]